MNINRLKYANAARHALIDKKFDKGLTLSEVTELAKLQDTVEKILEELYPLPYACPKELEALIGRLP